MKFKYGSKFETLDVTNEDLNSLQPQQWLTDNIIYCYKSTFKKLYPNQHVYIYYHMKNIFESNSKSIKTVNKNFCSKILYNHFKVFSFYKRFGNIDYVAGLVIVNYNHWTLCFIDLKGKCLWPNPNPNVSQPTPKI